jgi:acyl-CoA thioesterase
MSGQPTLAERITARMLAADAFSRWLGIEVVDVRERRAVLRMTVRPDMQNGFGVCHGGVTYALADSALAFASNSPGPVAMSIENTIRYPAPVHTGDVLTASATPSAASARLGFYDVQVTNQHGETVALFTGTTSATRQQHFPDSSA